jgi:exonuclease V gamma subunit
MSGLRLYTGLDLRSLAAKLTECIRERTSPKVGEVNPFARDFIIIDGKGTSNWLTHALVKNDNGKKGLGVHMNAELLNSRRFGPWLAGLLDGKLSTDSIDDPLSGLEGVIYSLIDEDDRWKQWTGDPEEDQGVVKWGLCQRIGRHFRELIRNDSQWVAGISPGAIALGDQWKRLFAKAMMELKKEIKDGEGKVIRRPRSYLHEVDVLKAISQGSDVDVNIKKITDQLPTGLSLFSTGDVAGTHLEILRVLSAHIPIDLFLVQPTGNFHADLAAEAKYEDALVSEGAVVVAPQRMNRAFDLLLAGGRYYRLQQDKVLKLLDPSHEEFIDGREAAKQPSLLNALKQSLNYFDSPAEWARNDDSLSIHRCHGAWREAEVVRDELMAAFDDNGSRRLKDLKQGDVLILTPNPDLYAPILEAVLSQRNPSFHFATAGIYGGKKSPVGALVKALLELPSGRVTSLDILNLLSLQAVRSRMDWDDDDLDKIEEWFREGPFLWGVNSQHRTEIIECMPAKDSLEAEGEGESEIDESDLMAGTLDDFIKRLSLGTAYGGMIHAVSEPGHEKIKRLPLRGVAGQQDLRLADQLTSALVSLRDWADFARPRVDQNLCMGEWLQHFDAVLDVLRPTHYTFAEHLIELNRSISALRRRVKLFGDKPIWLELFRSIVDEQCDFSAGAGQFMSGSITLAPLRASSIHPARLIVFMGMDDGVFPSKVAKVGPEIYKDKVYLDGNKKPLSGDLRTFSCRAVESQEDAGMHAFLLALLAADDRVLITFDGYANAEGKKAGAALPVEILRRVAVDMTSRSPASKDIFRYRTHGINAHSRALEPRIDAPGLAKSEKEVSIGRTYDQVAKDTSISLGKPKYEVFQPDLSKGLAAASLPDLIRFWASPPRQGLRMLNVHVPYEEAVLPTESVMGVDSSTVRSAKDWIKSAKKEGTEVEPSLWDSAGKYAGMFPVGNLGKELFERLVQEDKEGTRWMQEMVAKVLNEKVGNLSSCQIYPMRTERFELYLSGEHLAVVSFDPYYETNAYRWLYLLPALDSFIHSKSDNEIAAVLRVLDTNQIAKLRKNGLKKVLFVGLKAPELSEEDLSIDVEPHFNAIEVGFSDDARKLLSRYESFAKLALNRCNPALPKLLAKAIKGRLMNKLTDGEDPLIKDANDKIIRKTILSQKDIVTKHGSDRTDPRARIFIPEIYLFEELLRWVGWGDEANALIPRDSTRRTARELGVTLSQMKKST